jgi:hypothetical protein
MRQQTKPFIIERKPSRKLKSDTNRPSIWGKLDLNLDQDPQLDRDLAEERAVGRADDHR